MRRKQAPDLARVFVARAAIQRPHTEIFQPYALAVQHAKDVVIRNQQQGGRIRERSIVREPLRVSVSVRTDDGQVAYRFIKAASNRTHRGICRKQSVRRKSVTHVFHSGLVRMQFDLRVVAHKNPLPQKMRSRKCARVHSVDSISGSGPMQPPNAVELACNHQIEEQWR